MWVQDGGMGGVGKEEYGNHAYSDDAFTSVYVYVT